MLKVEDKDVINHMFVDIKGNGVSGYNVSERYKMLWYAPSRTGTRGISQILSYYGFTRDGYPIYMNGIQNYSHLTPTNGLYQDYQTICSTRNPYSRTVSIFKNYVKKKTTFKDFIFKEIPSGDFEFIYNPKILKPFDYLIKLENLFEDLTKLPFIFEVLNKNQLELLCQHGKEIDEWESYYDEETKDRVYELLKDHFLFWGYEK
jgi:hypothetical protein